MKFKLILCIFFIINLNCYANTLKPVINSDTVKHKKTKLLTIQELAKQHKPWFDDCTFTNQYTIAQRLKKYPFSKAKKILAVSYHVFDEPSSHIIIDSPGISLPTDTLRNKGLQIIKNRLDYSNLIEVKRLSKQDINRLTNILFNTDYKVKGLNGIGADACFEPRNAIVFLDSKGKAFNYLEICFECQNYSSKYDRLDIGTICNQKYDLLRKYFISVGIKYGTKKHVHGND